LKADSRVSSDKISSLGPSAKYLQTRREKPSREVSSGQKTLVTVLGLRPEKFLSIDDTAVQNLVNGCVFRPVVLKNDGEIRPEDLGMLRIRPLRKT
jgi:hypothetical protein